MMKRIFSKRSGFTLVEIIIAFAVFAIMAAMILQILNLVVYEKNSNADYVEKLRQQEELIVKNGKNGEYDDNNKTNDLHFAFGTDDYSIGYQMMFPEYTNDSGDVVRFENGLAYYIGPGAGKDDGNIQNPGEVTGNASAGSQMERLDTRISGTRGFNSINVYQVVKDSSYAGPGARYFFEVSADGKNMPDEMVPYAQFKMYFYMKDELDAEKSNVTYTDTDGNTYQRKVPKAAKITDAGYVNSNSLSWNNSTCKSFSEYGDSSQPGQNTYNIKKLNDNCIRIGSPYVTGNSAGVDINYQKRGIRFKQSDHSRFYVVFEKDPELTVDSFGECFGGQENVKQEGSKTVYKNVPILDENGLYSGNDYINIYGAFEYRKKTN